MLLINPEPSSSPTPTAPSTVVVLDPETSGASPVSDAANLDSLERTRLFDAYDDANTLMHISGKGYDKPGWVIVSTYNCSAIGAWTCEKVMAVKLDGGRILNLAHTYSCGQDYWTETQAVVNRWFTLVYFKSDGGSCGMAAEVYRLDVATLE